MFVIKQFRRVKSEGNTENLPTSQNKKIKFTILSVLTQ